MTIFANINPPSHYNPVNEDIDITWINATTGHVFIRDYFCDGDMNDMDYTYDYTYNDPIEISITGSWNQRASIESMVVVHLWRSIAQIMGVR